MPLAASLEITPPIADTRAPPPRLAGPIPPAKKLSMFSQLRLMRDQGLETIPLAAYEQPVFEQNLLWFKSLMISDPAGVKQVLLDKVANYPKTALERRFLRIALGDGLLATEGDTWRAHRRLMAPSFDPRSLVGYAPAMVASTETHLKKWDALPAGSTIDASSEMMYVTLQIISRTMFSTDSDALVDVVADTMHALLDIFRFGPLDILPVVGPWRFRRRELNGKRVVAKFDERIHRLIAERSAAPQVGSDLLGRLIAARDEDTGIGMTTQELRDHVVTIFLAGHETTAVAMTWIWYLLSQHPAVEARLHDELASVLGGRAPTYEDLPRLTYTRMVIDEAMRLYPSAPGLSAREALEDDEIAGTPVRKGTIITIMPWVIHRHRALWDEPERFDPERFSPARNAGRHRFAYIPFGAGPRICVGAALAVTETMLILATMAQRYRLHLVPGHPVEPQAIVTLRARRGMKMVLERRN